MERKVVRLLMFGEEYLDEEDIYEKIKKHGIMRSQTIKIILYFYFC